MRPICTLTGPGEQSTDFREIESADDADFGGWGKRAPYMGLLKIPDSLLIAFYY